MGDLFKALQSGIARFVYAWIVPSAVVTGVFALVVMPQLGVEMKSTAGGLGVFTLVVIALSVVFAYTARPAYQFLEGYTMPEWLAAPLTRRSQRRWLGLKRVARANLPVRSDFAMEQLKWYPEGIEDIMPTRLGNALRAMEAYGQSTYGLDSQSLWYEIEAVADEKVARSTAEARAGVDFFLSSIVHLALLTMVSAGCVFAADSKWPVVFLAAGAAVLVPLAYRQAVLNVGEWRWTVQALVNTSRPALASALYLQMPTTYEEEALMWQRVAGLVHYGPNKFYFDVLDPLRIGNGRGITRSGPRE